jgi:hypothetical protein
MRASREDLRARQAASEAFTCEGSSAVIADAFAAAVTAGQALEPGDGPAALLRSGYVGMLEVLEQLHRWDAAVQASERESGRYLDAAHRNASLWIQRLEEGDSSHEPLRRTLRAASELSDPQQLGSLRTQVSQLPVPMRLLSTPKGSRIPVSEAEAGPPAPRVVVLLQIADQPLSGPVLVHPQRAYDLQVEARVLDWPSWAEHLTIRFLSRWQGTAAHVPDIDLARPVVGSDGIWREVVTSAVVVMATPSQPEKPLLFTVEAQLTGPNRSEVVEVLGYAELALHAYDPSLDFITGSEVIDRRVYEVLVEVNASGVGDAERDAFADLFKTLANEAQALVANRTFRAGEHVLESQFQARLLERAQSVLGAANVRTGSEIGGGEMDIVYLDTLTAELKVERQTAATLGRASQYLGQPVQYASSAGRQLSILCILDITDRDTPVGVLANGISLFRPKLAGLDDPAYPSLVGVIIVSGGLPRPSEWSGKRIDTEN